MKKSIIGAIAIIVTMGVMSVFSPVLKVDASHMIKYGNVKTTGTETTAEGFVISTINENNVEKKYLTGYIGTQDVITIPDVIDEIAGGAFSDNTTIKRVHIPANVQYINMYAFQNCTNLTTVTIAENGKLEGIVNHAFSNCKKLSQINIPNSTEFILDYAFENCEQLDTINIPASVNEIGYLVFAGCDSLERIIVDNGNTTYSSIDGVLYDKNITKLVQYPVGKSNLTIPSTVKTIGKWAFDSCNKITAIDIPSNVTVIEEYAFQNCVKLESVTLPNSIKKIPAYAFSQSIGLKMIEIPNSVTEIGEYAFSGIPALVKADIPDSVTKIGLNAFGECTNLTIFCNKDSFVHKYAIANNIKVSLKNQNTNNNQNTNSNQNTNNNQNNNNQNNNNQNTNNCQNNDNSGNNDSNSNNDSEDANSNKVEDKVTVTCNVKEARMQVGKTTTAIKVNLAKGDKVVSWKSSNTKVATVTNTGKVKAKKAGTAKITVITQKGATTSVKIRVQNEKVNVKSLKTNKSSISLKKGKSFKIEVTKNPITATNKISYTSSNKKVATVSSKGVIKAKSKGTCKITCKSDNGKKKTIKVKVK